MTGSALQLTSENLIKTHALGQAIGSYLEPGNILALSGDLGSGKTSLVQGIGAGMNVSEEFYITSPTYTIINEYPGRCTLYHIDLYRLKDITDLEDIGFDELLSSNGVCAIEWADMLPDNYLTGCLSLRFEIKDDDSRDIIITAYGNTHEKLIEKLREYLEKVHP